MTPAKSAAKLPARALYIPSLDGIRALAILCVFGAHLGYPFAKMMPGGFAVAAFFFLSGYLITTLMRREFEKTRDISLRNFYLRRALRIFPPMYLVFVVALCLDLTDGSRGFTAPAAVAQALYLTNYVHAVGNPDDIVPYTTQFWSLAVEEHFYLAYPPALILLLRRYSYQRIALILAAACGAILIWRCILVFAFHVGESHMYVATDTRIDSILFGCILALWNNPRLDRGFDPSLAWKLAAGGALLILGSFVITRSAFSNSLRYTVQGVGLLPLFYCAVRFHDTPFFSWLEAPLMRGLGVISYTFYLSHMGCIKILEGAFGVSPIVVLGSFAAAVAFSTASYFLLERRLGVLRSQLQRRRAAAVEPAPALARVEARATIT